MAMEEPGYVRKDYSLLGGLGSDNVCVFPRRTDGRTTAQDSLTSSDQKLIAWFDSLGFPELAKKPCVRVATGNLGHYSDDPPENTYRVGFLLAEKRDEFTVFLVAPELDARTYRRSPPGTPEYQPVGYNVQDLKELAAAKLGELRHADKQSEPPTRTILGRVSERTWGPRNCSWSRGPAPPTGWNLWPMN